MHIRCTPFQLVGALLDHLLPFMLLVMDSTSLWTMMPWPLVIQSLYSNIYWCGALDKSSSRDCDTKGISVHAAST